MQSATNTAQAETWEQRQEREGRERLAWFNDKMKNVAALLGAYTSEPWAWQEPEEPALWNPSGSLVGPDDKEIHATLDGYRKQGRMRYSLDERQIARLKPLVLGHTAARLIELPEDIDEIAPWDKVVRVLQADGLEIGRITMGEAFALPAEDMKQAGAPSGALRERSSRVIERFEKWVESGRFEDRFGRILDALESPTGRAAVVLALIVLVLIVEALSRTR